MSTRAFKTVRTADCHPERPHCAKGLCAPCYAKHAYEANREARRAQMRSYVARRREREPDYARRAVGTSGWPTSNAKRSEARALARAARGKPPHGSAAAVVSKQAQPATGAAAFFARRKP